MMAFQSGMFDSCNPADDGDEILPALLLRSKLPLAGRSQLVIAPPALLRLLHPYARNPAFFLQTMQQWIERGDMKSQSPARSNLNQLRDVIPVARLILDQRHHQQLRAALLPFRISCVQGHIIQSHIWDALMSTSG